jgi:hypothetical protein
MIFARADFERPLAASSRRWEKTLLCVCILDYQSESDKVVRC